MDHQDDDLDSRLRGYQREMLEASLRGNAIVVMPTGSGKTLVAIARIRAELERSDPAKLIWFLANSVELSRQQLGELRQHLPAYHILSLTGQDGVDNWSQQHLWDAVLANAKVVVGTPAVLKDALTHGFVRMSRLSLLVFDEAHHCIKDHPMNAIMKSFFHPAKRRAESVPAVLGLTASPAINPKEGSLTQLETNMDATVATPKQSLEELLKFVYPVQLTMLTYATSNAPEYPGASQLCLALEKAAVEYDFAKDPYVVELGRYDDERSRRALQKVREKMKTYCSEQIRVLNRRAATLCYQLGVGSAEAYIRDCIGRFQRGAVHHLLLPDTTTSEQQHLLGILRAVSGPSSANACQRLPVSAKAQRLVYLLSKQTPEFVREGKAIVFVRDRATVVGLTHLLRDSPELAVDYRVGGFVGTSSFERRSSFADLAEPQQQARDLDDFRHGTKNLMVATSVLEEGIDVRECNLVVNFDAPDTLIGFLQRRGRARMEHSKYYVLVPENDCKIDLLKWQAEEAKSKREYMDAFRERVEAESQDEEAVNIRVYRVLSTGAMVTFDDAKAHLDHFCSVSTLQANNYVDYFAEKTAGERLWTATVTLPSYVHEDVRIAFSREAWRSESAAIKDAAFEAYVALHKAGLLNDNLLPLAKEPRLGDGEQHFDQPSLMRVAERTSSWSTIANNIMHPGVQLYSALVSFSGFMDLGSVRIVLPANLTQAEHFTLYWNQQASYCATVSSSSAVTQTPERLEVLRSVTDTALRTLHESRMPSEERQDFLLLLDLPDSPRAGCTPALDYFRGTEIETTDIRLVHVNGRHGLLYIFQQLVLPSPDCVSEEPKLVVTRFPKRRDFLHPVPQRQSANTAYTTEEVHRASDCSVARISLPTCLFSAFLPSIMHRIDIRLLAQCLQTTTLGDVEIRDTALIIEAISAPSAGEEVDYNRLEYLGDAILKFCASLQVIAQHTTWPERYLTEEKLRLVRNSTLCHAALDLSLDKYILTKPFTGAKWRPPYASEVLAAERNTTREMSSKTLADVMEALLGAAYVDGGLGKAYCCIKNALPRETWYSAEESFEHLTANLSPCNLHMLEALELLIGHHFNHQTLLVEAVTHASLPFQRTGMSYERLEFLGDAVLDLIIVPKLHAHPRKLKHFELHSIHEALVNGLFLGHSCMRYGIDQKEDIVTQGDDTYEIQHAARRIHLHDFIRAGGQLLNAKQASLEAFEKYGELVEEALNAGLEYPWPDLHAMGPQKFFSDLVESVLGALYIDTRGDLDICEGFLEKLGIMRHMQTMLDSDMETMSPKERLGVLAGNETVRYVGSIAFVDSRRVMGCTVQVGVQVVACSSGCGSNAEAEARAAYEATRVLQDSALAKTRKPDSVGDVRGGTEEASDDDDAGGVVI